MSVCSSGRTLRLTHCVRIAGETASDTELSDHADLPPRPASRTAEARASFKSTAASGGQAQTRTRSRAKSVSMHDLYHRFFRQDVVVLSNIDLFR